MRRVHLAILAVAVFGCEPVPAIDSSEFRDSDEPSSGGNGGGGGSSPGGGGGSGAADPGGCRTSTSCGFDQVCVRGECTPALDRAWTITVLGFEAATTKPNGDGWDIGGGAPDPYAVFGLLNAGGTEYTTFCSTVAIADSFRGSWNEDCDFVIPSGGALGIDVWDGDLADPDSMLSVAAFGNDGLMDILKQYGSSLEYSNGNVSLFFRVDPTF